MRCFMGPRKKGKLDDNKSGETKTSEPKVEIVVEQSMGWFADLPHDIINMILGKLEPSDLASVSAVSKYFKQKLNGSQKEFWNNYAVSTPLKPETKRAVWLLSRYISGGYVEQIDYDFLWSLIVKMYYLKLGQALLLEVRKNQSVLDKLYQHISINYTVNSLSAARKSSNGTILFWAAYCNQPQQLKRLISLGASLFLTVHGENIPLSTLDRAHCQLMNILACCGNSEVMKILFENGVSARIVVEGHPFASPIRYAVVKNQSSALQVLLEHGADSNLVIDSDGTTLLMRAAYNGSLEAVKLLVKHLAYCDSISKTGNTALKLATSVNQYDIVTFLLDHGANCNLQTSKYKNLPLHLAIQWAAEDKVSLALIKLLAFYTDNIDAADHRGDTALMIAVSYKLYEIIHILVSLGANINAPCGEHKLTPYACALHSGDDKCLEALLANINSEADLLIDGKTPLTFFSSVASGLRGVTTSLRLGHDVNACNSNGHYPLIIAAERGHLDIVTALLNAGADVNVANINGATALRFAVEIKYDEIAAALLNKGANANQANQRGTTPLWIAALAGNLNMLNLLLNHGANPSTSTSQELQTILQQAKEDCPESLERALIYLKNCATNSVNISALDIAKIMGHTEVAALLESKITPEEETTNKRKKLQ